MRFWYMAGLFTSFPAGLSIPKLLVSPRRSVDWRAAQKKVELRQRKDRVWGKVF